jgi:phage shock protein PspC (stress-responsive transcriptional regulator)
MTTTTIILINVGILTFGVIFYIIWNLMRKNEKLEDAIVKRDNI